MIAVRLDQLVSSVVDKLPAAPIKGQTIRALREAAKRFCFETEAWKETLAAMSLVANQKLYTLATDWQAEIRRIHSVHTKTAAEVADGVSLGTEWDRANDTYTPATREYRFYSAPSTTAISNGLVFKIVLIPHFQTDELPEWLVSLYGDAFVFGAVEELCSHKGAGELYDPDTAMRYGKRFNGIKSNVMAEVFRGYQNASPTFHPLYNTIGELATSTGYRVGG